MRRALAYTRIPLRSFTTSIPRLYSSPFNSGPSPPRLPKEEQERFEKLQRQSTGAFSTPRDEPSPSASTASSGGAVSTSPTTSSTSQPRTPFQVNQSPDSASNAVSASAAGDSGAQVQQGDEVHPNMRRGALPEFEGEVNPKTGEVGGPKNEPLRWGAGGDWSFNGRVTDF